MAAMPTTAAQCPCGSARPYDSCCGPAISGAEPAGTAEALMRSRYTAYVKAEIPYLRETLAPEARGDFDEAAARKWAVESTWLGLEILSTQGGAAADREGTVTFAARYAQGGTTHEHRELASFKKDAGGRWHFVDAKPPKNEPVVREAPKVGRNDPCPCGSGKKHKKCCGA